MGQKILVVLSLCSKRLSCGIYWFKISVCDAVSEFNDDICKVKVLHMFTQGIIGQLKSSLNSQSAFQFFLVELRLLRKSSNFLLLRVILTSYMMLKFTKSNKFYWVQVAMNE